MDFESLAIGMVFEFDVIFSGDDQGEFRVEVGEEVTIGEGVVIGAENGFLDFDSEGLETVDESMRLPNGAEGIDFGFGGDWGIDLEGEWLEVLVVVEDARCAFGAD